MLIHEFHNFNTHFRNNPLFEVVCFTAEQIPDIDGREYPPVLSGKLYPNGIPIYSESELSKLIKKHDIDVVCFSYSDVSYDYIMKKSAVVNAAGADFLLLGTKSTQVKSTKPVISVTAVRTGCGKSQTSRKIVDILKKKGLKTVAIRHPMPYGDLSKQVWQRFATYEDMLKHKCTIEEMEEYEPYTSRGLVVYAGVDYEKILREAEKEADIILWDGGNNDFSFYKTDLSITVLDPHRAGNEITYYPGQVCFLTADVLVINKMETASPENIEILRKNIEKYNPKAMVIEGASPVSVDRPELIKGKRVLVIEDGPTLTHGGMKIGAGTVAAQKYGAKELVDPRQYAVGKIAKTFRLYPNIGTLLPAMGYDDAQVKDLQETIDKVDCDAVVIGTPIDLGKLIKINKPSVRVEYNLQEIGKPDLQDVLDDFVKKHNL